MQDWLTSENRKVHQRKLNKTLRNINNNIENDNLWRGRFIMRQVGGQWNSYGNPNEHYYWVQIVMIDKKTGTFRVFADEDNTIMFGSKYFWKINNFIVDDCKVWENEGREELYEKDKNQYTDWKVEIKGTWNPDIKITNPNGEVVEGKRVY